MTTRDELIIRSLDKQRTIIIDKNLDKMRLIKQWAIDNNIECEIYKTALYDTPGFIFWFPNQMDAMACKLIWL